MKNRTHRRTPSRYLLLLLILPLGCLLVQDGEAEPMAAATAPPPIFQPPFGSDVLPADTVTVSPGGGMVSLPSGTDITVPENAFVSRDGQPVTDPVTLTVREFLNPMETWLGGVPMNMGDHHVLRSAGMMEIRGTTPDGGDVELAQGKSLQLDWYSVDPDTAYVSWVLDTASGTWKETGERNAVTSRDLDAELRTAEAALPPRVSPVETGRYAFDIGDMTGKQPAARPLQRGPIRACGREEVRPRRHTHRSGAHHRWFGRRILGALHRRHRAQRTVQGQLF